MNIKNIVQTFIQDVKKKTKTAVQWLLEKKSVSLLTYHPENTCYILAGCAGGYTLAFQRCKAVA